MFTSGTKDMVPRCAPKPTASEIPEALLRPSVPEISVVFSQPNSRQTICTSPPSMTSYAVWKNKCLVSDSHAIAVKSISTECSPTLNQLNVYPLETRTQESTPCGQIPLSKQKPANTANKSVEHTVKTSYAIEPQTALCSKMSTSTNLYCKNCENSNQNNQFEPIYQRPLENKSSTSCAGTQTDSFLNNVYFESYVGKLATKEDIAHMNSTIAGIQTDQHQILEIVQLLLNEIQKPTCGTNQASLRDVGTQCEGHQLAGIKSAIRDESKNIDYAKEDIYDQQKIVNFNSPKIPTTGLTIPPGLLRPTTEQSLVMNELALKYLPNRKLDDLFQEIPIEKQVQNQYESPLKKTEKLYKNPTDLSTSSYKYLRKYRLLPEDNQNLHPAKSAPISHVNKRENLLDLETIRRKPKFM